MYRIWSYLAAQLLSLPLLFIPAFLAGWYVERLVLRFTDFEPGWGPEFFAFILGFQLYRSSRLLVGRLLERVGLLPIGGNRIYPRGRSWAHYANRDLWTERDLA